MLMHYMIGTLLMACAFSGCFKKSEAKSGWVCPECQCGEDNGCGCSPENGCKCAPGEGCKCKGGNCTK